MAPSTSSGKVKQVWLGLHSTPDERGWYKVGPQSRFNQLFVFTRKSTIGDATKDSDDFVSSWISGDWSGGGQVEDLNEGAETSRFWFAVADTRSPNQIALPPLVTAERPNANCASCWPLDVGNDGVMYLAFNESGTWEVWGFDEATEDFDYNAGAGVALGAPPTGKAVRFDGVLYVPTGTSSGGGYARVTGIAGTPTCAHVAGSADPSAAAPTSAPRAVAFAIYDEKLWALTAQGGLAYHTVAQKAAGANAWSWPFGDTTTDFPKLEGSAAPKALIVFPDKNGVESIYAKSDRGLHVYDDTHPRFVTTDVRFPPHPDINRAVAVWRPGEALHVGIGLDDWKYTAADTVVPFSGLARDHGLPIGYRGAILDLAAEPSGLFAVVGGAQDHTYAFAAKLEADGTGDGQFDTPVGCAWSTFNSRLYVADAGNTRVQLLTSTPAYDAKFSTTGTPTAVAVRNNGGRVYVGEGTDALRYYTSAGALEGAFSGVVGGVTGIGVNQSTGSVYYATDGGASVFVANSAGTALSSWTSEYGGLGSLAALAVHPGTGDVYVAIDEGAGGNNIVEQYTSAGAFLRAWGNFGSSLSGDDGSFDDPVALAVHPVTGHVFVADAGRHDVQEFTATGVFVRAFAQEGSGDGQLDAPNGLAVDAAGTLYVANHDAAAADGVQTFQLQSAVARATMHEWTGVGWHTLWEHAAAAATPTVMTVASATDGYRLWWGMDDGLSYRMGLPRNGLHNPRLELQSGVGQYATSGYLVTGKFDAAMMGFDKIASHLTVFTRHATSNESILVEHNIDDGGWQALGTVATTGRTVLPFNVVDGFSRGRRFNWVQFRLRFSRNTVSQTPLLDSMVLAYQKVPQNTVSHTLDVDMKANFNGRTPAEQYEDLTQLVTAGEMLKLVIGRDSTASDGTVVSAVKRVLPATVSGLHDAGTKMGRTVTVGLIEVRTGED